MIIARYDIILDQSDRAHLCNHLLAIIILKTDTIGSVNNIVIAILVIFFKLFSFWAGLLI